MEPDSYLIVGIIVVTLLNLAPNILAVKQIFGGKSRNEITPQPLEVKEYSQYVTRSECDERHGFNNQAHLRIHEDHNNLAREVSELTATVSANGQRLVQMDTKLDTLLIRSTKV